MLVQAPLGSFVGLRRLKGWAFIAVTFADTDNLTLFVATCKQTHAAAGGSCSGVQRL